MVRVIEGRSGRSGEPEGELLYSTSQLSRILKVPSRRIRDWVRRGLIEPVRTGTRGQLFDFRQMTELERLRKLTDEGVSTRDIRRSLDQAKRWMPEEGGSLARLSRPEGESRLLVRTEAGTLAEPSGQLRLDFDGGPTSPGPDRITPMTLPSAEEDETTPELPAEQWFERAVAFEEAGNLDHAAAAYEQALELGEPRADAAFNLGNVLVGLGRLEDAVPRFEEALAAEPRWVEAWNNLASVHAHLENWPEAIEAGCRAVDLEFDYPDAHYNLAEAYHAAGRPREARRHARIYLKFDPKSEWAERLRETLELN